MGALDKLKSSVIKAKASGDLGQELAAWIPFLIELSKLDLFRQEEVLRSPDLNPAGTYMHTSAIGAMLALLWGKPQLFHEGRMEYFAALRDRYRPVFLNDEPRSFLKKMLEHAKSYYEANEKKKSPDPWRYPPDAVTQALWDVLYSTRDAELLTLALDARLGLSSAQIKDRYRDIFLMAVTTRSPELLRHADMHTMFLDEEKHQADLKFLLLTQDPKLLESVFKYCLRVDERMFQTIMTLCSPEMVRVALNAHVEQVKSARVHPFDLFPTLSAPKGGFVHFALNQELDAILTSALEHIRRKPERQKAVIGLERLMHNLKSIKSEAVIAAGQGGLKPEAGQAYVRRIMNELVVAEMLLGMGEWKSKNARQAVSRCLQMLGEMDKDHGAYLGLTQVESERFNQQRAAARPEPEVVRDAVFNAAAAAASAAAAAASSAVAQAVSRRNSLFQESSLPQREAQLKQFDQLIQEFKGKLTEFDAKKESSEGYSKAHEKLSGFVSTLEALRINMASGVDLSDIRKDLLANCQSVKEELSQHRDQSAPKVVMRFAVDIFATSILKVSRGYFTAPHSANLLYKLEQFAESLDQAPGAGHRHGME